MTRFLLDYDDGVVRVRWDRFTNHKLRDVITGLWLALDEHDRRDHIAELEHYFGGGRPPGSSKQMGDALREARSHG